MAQRHYLNIFFSVQKALFLRELNMRFSVNRLGIFWTFFEPFIQIVLFVFIKLFLFGDTGENFDFAVFLALNFIAYNMFKHIITRSIGSFSANKGLFIYKQVKPIDTIIARTLVEVFITGILIIVFIMIGVYFQYDMNVKDINMVITGYILMVFFSFSLALVLASLNVFVKSVKHVVGFMMYLFMFGSAVFYTVDILSPELKTVLLYNPLVHIMEMIHGSYFYVISDYYVDYTYILIWTLCLLFVGLWTYIRLEEKIVSL